MIIFDHAQIVRFDDAEFIYDGSYFATGEFDVEVHGVMWDDGECDVEWSNIYFTDGKEVPFKSALWTMMMTAIKGDLKWQEHATETVFAGAPMIDAYREFRTPQHDFI